MAVQSGTATSSHSNDNTTTVSRKNGILPSFLGYTTVIASASRNFYADWDWTCLKYYAQNQARFAYGDSRLAICLRLISPMKSTVEIRSKNNVAHYRNLCRCSRVWLCPVCADTITSRRRDALATVLDTCGLYPIGAAYTFSHYAGLPLQSSLSGLLEAYRLFTSGRAYQRLSADLGIVGTIKALEVTLGVNGWHPHLHTLWLCREPVDIGQSEARIRSMWLDRLQKLALSGNDHALKLTDAKRATAEYLAKFGKPPEVSEWTAQHEMTRYQVKQARSGLSIFGLVCALGVPDLPDSRKRQIVPFLREYRDAVNRRHQLQVSRSIKHLFDDVTDAEIVESEGSDYDLIATLSMKQWDTILRRDLRGEVLRVASLGHSDQFEQFLKGLG